MYNSKNVEVSTPLDYDLTKVTLEEIQHLQSETALNEDYNLTDWTEEEDKVSDSEINDLIDMYFDDVFSWALEEWITHQLMLGKTSNIDERLKNNHYLKLIKHNLGRE